MEENKIYDKFCYNDFQQSKKNSIKDLPEKDINLNDTNTIIKSPNNFYVKGIKHQDLKSPQIDTNESKIFLKKLALENEENNLRSLISTSRTQLEKIDKKFNNITNTAKNNKNLFNYSSNTYLEISPLKKINHYIEKEEKENNFNFNKNENKNENSSNFPISQEIRISNLEKRLESIEKILHFYDEMFRLKNEERLNEERIDKNKLLEISKKINSIEENYKFNNFKFKENNEFDKKIENLEKKLKKFQEKNNSIGEYYAEKLSEFEEIYKKTEVFLDTKVEDKIISLQKNYDNKLEDIVNLINEFTIQLDKNEFNLVENREGIRNIQIDHMDFLEIITILKEKANSMDYVMDQITDLKFKYNKVLNNYGIRNNNNITNQEEDQIVKNITNMNINENNDN